MNRETAAKGDQTTVLGWHRGEGGLLVGEANRVSVDLSSVSLKFILFLWRRIKKDQILETHCRCRSVTAALEKVACFALLKNI